MTGDQVLVNSKLMEYLSKQRLNDIFGKDIMSFDDYNYGLLNDYIFNVVKSTLQSEDQSDASSFRVEDLDESPVDEREIVAEMEERERRHKLFNKDQIFDILVKQNTDVFDELVGIKNVSAIDNLKQKNLVNLDE